LKKTSSRRKKSAGKKRASRPTTAARRKPARGRKAARSAKPARGRKAARSAKPARRKKAIRAARESPADRPLHVGAVGRRGLGAASAGQSGDTQGLSRGEAADSESVEELVEEGQDFEAGVVAGVEEADDDPGEVRTRQFLEDDVPPEYLDKD